MTEPDGIIGVHRCGDRHQVVTVRRQDSFRHRRSPCPDCPWRRDRPTGVFPPEAFRHSATTCYDMAPTTFGCHMTGTGRPRTCAGFLLSGHAIHNFRVRLALARGRLDLSRLSSPVPLFETYPEMAVANGVASDDPVLAPCRT